MSPLVNALLGVLFLGVGAAATLLMYRLRGASPPGPAPPAAPDGETGTGDAPAAALRRASDDLEIHLAAIHAMGESGRSIIEPSRRAQRT